MNFLDKLVLPQSLEHATLLHFLSIIVMVPWVSYLSLIFGGALLSSYFNKKGKHNSDSLASKFAKDIIEISTISKSVGLSLGILPLIVMIIINLQLFHGMNLLSAKILILALPLLLTAMVLIYIYRYSFLFSNLLKDGADKSNSEVGIYSEKVDKLFLSSGKWMSVFIFISTYLLCAGNSLSASATSINTNSVIESIFSFQIIFNWLMMLSFAVVLTSLMLLFRFFYWEGGKETGNTEYLAFIKASTVKIAFIFSLPLPILLMLDTVMLPAGGLSNMVFLLVFAAMIMIFIIAHYLYGMLKENSVKAVPSMLVLIVMVGVFITLSNQIILSNVTTKNSMVLSVQYEESIAEMKKNSTAKAGVNAAEIYKTKCSSCHKFDMKLVGPAYKLRVPTYNGDVDKLASFIYNPVRVNPVEFPSGMPNQGLKPAEAKAMARWLIEEVKKY